MVVRVMFFTFTGYSRRSNYGNMRLIIIEANSHEANLQLGIPEMEFSSRDSECDESETLLLCLILAPPLPSLPAETLQASISFFS